MNDNVKVESVKKTEDGGILVVFVEGDKKHPVSFSNSFFKVDGSLDGARFLLWGAVKAPFDFDRYELPPVLIVADCINQIEEVLNVE